MKGNLKSGFGLIEVTVALGILSGIILLFTNLNKQTTQAVLKTRIDQEVTLVVNEMIAILSDPTDCIASLGGKSAALTEAGVIEGITSKGQKKFTVNSPIGESNLVINSYLLNGNDKDVSLATNTTSLEIHFTRKKAMAGFGDIIRKIRLYVKMNEAGAIVNCRSLSSSAADIWTRGSGGEISYSGGNVGVDQAKPLTKLDVNGELKISMSGTQCLAATEGSMRYNPAVKNMEFCNGSEWKQLGITDFNSAPKSANRYCVLMNACPGGWLDRGVVGILSNHKIGFNRCEDNQLGATGPAFGEDFVWCYPRLCCNN